MKGTFDNTNWNSAGGYDRGYDWFRQMADVSGDGRADYCRFVGGGSSIFLGCGIATSAGKFGAYEWRSKPGYDRGYDWFRQMVDVNGDGRADYCRFVGGGANIFLGCGLSTSTKKIGDYEWRSKGGYDRGYDWFRQMADVNGDGRADYCRFVGGGASIRLMCGLSGADKKIADGGWNSRGGIDRGYDWFRQMADVNGDGRADFCRFVGNGASIYLSCAISKPDGTFGNHEWKSRPGFDRGYDWFRRLVDVNGDGRADYCRFVGAAATAYLSCALSKPDGTFGDIDWNSKSSYDKGYSWFRYMADANYCRFVGNGAGVYLSCGLSVVK